MIENHKNKEFGIVWICVDFEKVKKNSIKNA